VYIVKIRSKKEFVQCAWVVWPSGKRRVINKRDCPKVVINAGELRYKGTVRASDIEKDRVGFLINVTWPNQGDIVVRGKCR
jgi:hypothetical protein